MRASPGDTETRRPAASCSGGHGAFDHVANRKAPPVPPGGAFCWRQEGEARIFQIASPRQTFDGVLGLTRDPFIQQLFLVREALRR